MEVTGVIVVEEAGSQAGIARAGRIEALEQVANRPIVHHVLDALEAAGVQDVVVASSDELAGDVRASLARREQGGLRLRYVEQQGPLHVAGALSLVAPMIGEAPCIVHLASGLLDQPLAPLMDRVRGDSPDVSVIVHQGSAPDEHLSAATQDLLHIAELDQDGAALGMAGVLLFGRDAVRRYCGEDASAADRKLDLTRMAHRITAAGANLHVSLADAWRRYAGDPVDLLELNRIALDRLEMDRQRPGNRSNRIEGRVRIHERAAVRASVIVGPTVIGPDARIADAYIGPYTSIGAGARIEGTEIERSIVAAGASITHVGGRLVGSIVGQDARIFRDFSLPRALRLRIGAGTEVALC
jgi:glucose-1-phosphate thymidylyltransferase